MTSYPINHSFRHCEKGEARRSNLNDPGYRGVREVTRRTTCESMFHVKHARSLADAEASEDPIKHLFNPDLACYTAQSTRSEAKIFRNKLRCTLGIAS